MNKVADSFFSLTPERILDAVEAALNVSKTGLRATGRTQVLNSIENRVYEIELEGSVDGPTGAERSVVTKFYRPGRWNAAQIEEEHLFLQALLKAEVPVVAPIELSDSPRSRLVSKAKTLAVSDDGIFFAVFPKVRGRLRDELDAIDLRNLGRFLGRLHAVGSAFPSKHRVHLDVHSYGETNLDFLLKSSFFDDVSRSRYERVVRDLLKTIAPQLQGVRSHAVHGDCHVGNVLWQEIGISPEGRREYTPFFVDFDDMVVAPPVQDVWMIVRGRDETAERDRGELLGAYELMRDFDYSTLSLIEPLRGLRLVHYAAWIARRWEDPSFPRMFPAFGTMKYWSEEIEALDEIRGLCESQVPAYDF